MYFKFVLESPQAMAFVGAALEFPQWCYAQQTSLLVLNGTANMTDYDIDGDDDDYGDRGNVVEYYGGAGGTEFSHGNNGGVKIDRITVYADKDVVVSLIQAHHGG